MEEKNVILIVDDAQFNRAVLKHLLDPEYTILEASNGIEAIEFLSERGTEISIVLLDAVMPCMDGFAVLKMMGEQHWLESIPVIMISAETSPEFIQQGYELGALDYIGKPYSADIVLHRVRNTISLYAKQKALQQVISEQIQAREKNNTLMVDILSTIVEFRNGESGAHVRRIRMITEFLLETVLRDYPNYALSASEIAKISNAAALHDVGKIMIPEHILNKPGKLTHEEFEVMKGHSQRGAEMLLQIRHDEQEQLLKYAYSICRWHHERWDGRGYPDGLYGNEIPICAQVVSIADVYDALVSPRIYKRAFSQDEALRMILNGECGAFNPDLIDCLLRDIARLEDRIVTSTRDSEPLFDIERLSREALEDKHLLVAPPQEPTRARLMSAPPQAPEYDTLTRLYNHRAARKYIEERLRSSVLCALAFVDIDDFQSFNNAYGHLVGDAVLRQTGATLSAQLRGSELAARVGGDEFILFLNRFQSPEELEERVRNLWQDLQVQCEANTFSISMGVALFPMDGTSCDLLFARAEQALYYCKRMGKHRYTFYRDLFPRERAAGALPAGGVADSSDR